MTVTLQRKNQKPRKMKKKRRKVKHQRKKVQVMKILTWKSPPKIREAKIQRVVNKRKKKDRNHSGLNSHQLLASRNLAHRHTYTRIISAQRRLYLLLRQRRSKAKVK